MIHSMNNKNVTTNELVRTVICSVMEDLQNNFEEYAKVFIKDYDSYNEEDLMNINKWKTKVFQKVNTLLKKKDLLDD